MAATALHEVRLDWSFQDTPAHGCKRLVYRGVQQTRYAAVLEIFKRVAPAAFDYLRSGSQAPNTCLGPDYCGPSSKITNEFAMGCGLGRGFSGLGFSAGLKSAVSVKT